MKGKLLTAKALLNPRIAINKKVEINYMNITKGEKVKNDYLVKKGKHSGSSWANDFYTDFECIAI